MIGPPAEGVILVGETNPYGSPARFDLYDEPANCAGDRLRRLVFGLERRTYLDANRIYRTNLCSGPWSLHRARAKAAWLLVDVAASREAAGAPPWPVWVLLGRRVQSAFGFRTAAAVDRRGLGGRMLLVPHPSGRCLTWNDPAVARSVRHNLRELVPSIPWGELFGERP